ncbi:hypothetical protein [Desulfosporosinus burensis]
MLSAVGGPNEAQGPLAADFGISIDQDSTMFIQQYPFRLLNISPYKTVAGKW